MSSRNQKIDAEQLSLPETAEHKGLSGGGKITSREQKRKSTDFKSCAWYEKARLSIGATSSREVFNANSKESHIDR
jgi:hypothetical protein